MRHRSSELFPHAASLKGGTRLRLCPLGAGTTAFSLVELLVVVAILGVLAAMILPALSASRHAAHRAQCGSQLRQLGVATQQYWEDNEGFCFRYKLGLTNQGDQYWFGWIERGAEGSREVDHRQGVLFPYLTGRGVEICPSLSYRSPQFKLKGKGATHGYGYNLELSAKPGRPLISVASIPRPAATALFADAAQINDFQAPASPEQPMLEEFYYVSPSEPTAHFRHSGRSQVLMCDGQVESEKAVAGSWDLRLPRERVGRLPREILVLRPWAVVAAP